MKKKINKTYSLDTITVENIKKISEKRDITQSQLINDSIGFHEYLKIALNTVSKALNSVETEEKNLTLLDLQTSLCWFLGEKPIKRNF